MNLDGLLSICARMIEGSAEKIKKGHDIKDIDTGCIEAFILSNVRPKSSFVLLGYQASVFKKGSIGGGIGVIVRTRFKTQS